MTRIGDTYLASGDLKVDTTDVMKSLFMKDNNYLLQKGIIIELLPIHLIESADEEKIFKAEYIYPPTLLLDSGTVTVISL